MQEFEKERKEFNLRRFEQADANTLPSITCEQNYSKLIYFCHYSLNSNILSFVFICLLNKIYKSILKLKSFQYGDRIKSYVNATPDVINSHQSYCLNVNN